MSDISKCSGTNCPLKNSCYRYTASSNSHWQSYLTEVPYKDGKCELYWNIKK